MSSNSGVSNARMAISFCLVAWYVSTGKLHAQKRVSHANMGNVEEDVRIAYGHSIRTRLVLVVDAVGVILAPRLEVNLQLMRFLRARRHFVPRETL